MTEVYTISSQAESAFGSSPLRRSTSQTSFLHQSYSRATSNVRSATYSQSGYEIKTPASLLSSAPSSPRLHAPDFSNQPSYTSTPSSLSLDETCDFQGDDILFPSYGDGLSHHALEPPESSPSPESYTADDSKQLIGTPSRTTAPPSSSDSFETKLVAGDDTAIRVEPSRHVDYLSHNWREEDIWSSWRHIVAKRNVYSNSPRLENASWRTWAKSKNRLKTVSPDSLNW